MLRLLFLVLILPIENAWARPILSVEKSSSEGILFEVQFPASFDILQTTPLGMARTDSAQLPFLSRLVGAPPGARLDVYVRWAEYEEFERVGWDSDVSTELVSIRPLGLLRGVETHAIIVSPYQYDARRNALRIYTRLRVEIRFTEGRQDKRARRTAPISSPYESFLNAEQPPLFVRERPRAKASIERWYDVERPWVKVTVDTDGIHQIDYRWLERFAHIESIDPQTLQLFCAGQEQPVYVAGEGDGRFDESDYLLFYGQFRRGT
ncbi:MAG: hypothetical protein VXU50_07370, partial [Verrucomicrobiota bacterium]|nr:hypothetical protein [Verrucomicrobiota bacterium]